MPPTNASEDGVFPSRLSANIIYKKADLADVEELTKYIYDQFVRREVLSVEHGLSFDNSASHVRYHIQVAITNGVVFMVKTRDSNQIKGVRISTIGGWMENEEDFGFLSNSVEAFFRYATSQFQLDADPNAIMRNEIVCLSPDLLRQGFSMELNHLVEDFAKERGVKYTTAICTSAIPEKLALRSGFKRIGKIDYADYSKMFDMSSDLQNVFARLAQKHECARLVVKELTS